LRRPAYNLDIDDLEIEAQRQEPEEPPSTTLQLSRATRGVNITAKYASLLSRKAKEQTQRPSSESETRPVQAEKEVMVYSFAVC
jgi:hypothetical protein